MKAAVLAELGGVPVYGEFPEPQATGGQCAVDVLAAGVNHFTLALCAGTTHLATPPVPFVPGLDGVGRLADGRRVFFERTVAPYGSWAERAVVHADSVVPFTGRLSDSTAAALGNTGVAAHTALSFRAQLQPGETVLVLGATGAVGTIAVQVAKALGASRVVAAAPESPRLQALLDLGADAVVATDPDNLEARLREQTGGPDVVVDTLWGPPALAALRSAATGCRFLQIGQRAGATLDLPASVLRPRGIQLIGYGLPQCPEPQRRLAYQDLVGMVEGGRLKVPHQAFPLANVGEVWHRQESGPRTKLVLLP